MSKQYIFDELERLKKLHSAKLPRTTPPFLNESLGDG
jgi:hypothetical protein